MACDLAIAKYDADLDDRDQRIQAMVKPPTIKTGPFWNRREEVCEITEWDRINARATDSYYPLLKGMRWSIVKIRTLAQMPSDTVNLTASDFMMIRDFYDQSPATLPQEGEAE